MAEWRKWSAQHDTSLSQYEGKRVCDPPGFDPAAAREGEASGATGRGGSRLPLQKRQELLQQQATAPLKQVAMLCFMMWMSGSTLHIFSIMMTINGIYQPLSSILKSKDMFPPDPEGELNTSGNAVQRDSYSPPASAAILKSKDMFPPDPEGELNTTGPRLTFCLMHSLGLAFAVYKIYSMGLLPTNLSDWVSSMRPPTVLEHASHLDPRLQAVLASGFVRTQFNMAQALSFAVAARPMSATRVQVRRPRADTLVARSAKRSEIDLSDEYTAVESMASQDDLLLYYNHQHETRNTRLVDVMQTNLILTTPETSLAEVTKLLDGPPSIEGLPVCDADKKLVGVISKKDLTKGGALVKDVMSTPPIALKATGKVADAALCMTEHKFHRVPVVDDGGVCVGIVTRTDIFWALTQSDQEGDEETPLSQHGLAL
ncbi:hypothetical protein COHA_001166 [Chlorella ohadii]|uniref:ER membrane protein complex subunit 4 n=1 Tax=Chlorella ohadii TaxID=2649997 RepID=A0AAD5E2C3_9CHLO|nr:hypothetical protein COHA_001166 [Chlorella ohadii]